MTFPGFQICPSCDGRGRDGFPISAERTAEGHDRCPDCVAGQRPTFETVDACARASYSFDGAYRIAWEDQDEWTKTWHRNFVREVLVEFAKRLWADRFAYPLQQPPPHPDRVGGVS